jgi:XRE family transcriptional regulator of biofilm formation
MAGMAAQALGRRVRRLREQRGFSQSELAQRSQISTQYLGEIERGRRDPSLSVAARLASALDSSLDFLALGEADSPAGIVSAWSRIPEELRSMALRILWALSDDEERRAARPEQRHA